MRAFAYRASGCSQIDTHKPAIIRDADRGSSRGLGESKLQWSSTVTTEYRNRISVPEIARRLELGRQAIYEMLERGMLPGIRLRKRWIITRHAYLQWEDTCGFQNTRDFRRPDTSATLAV